MTAHASAQPEAWLREQIGSPPQQRVRFLWAPGFLDSALAESTVETRGADRTTNGTTVLADIFMMNEQTFSIEGQLLQAPHNKFTLQLRLIVPPQDPGTPGVVLKWGTIERRASFRNGSVTIDNLPPLHPNPKPPNYRPPEFSVTLVFDNP